MLPKSLILILLACATASRSQHTQRPFSAPKADDGYEFKWPIKRVAIIGAGVSGLIAYREFTRTGDFDTIRVFERDDVPGGNWHYTEETPLDAPIPNADPVVGDFVPSLPPSLPAEEVYPASEARARWREHRGPKPVWDSLGSNAPAPIQQITELPWPPGTPWQLPHRTLAKYLRAFASFHGINSNDDNPDVSYNTRVELVEKKRELNGQHRGWTLTLKRLEHLGYGSVKASWWSEDFDAIVVATGRYNAPNIPAIPGLKEWSERFPRSILHSRQYRRPETFANETVLVIGAGTSAVEISREVNPLAHKIYQSVRAPNPHLPKEIGRIQLHRLPANISIVPDIRTFHPDDGSVQLLNGTRIRGITRIVFATGFRYSFPFLPHLHGSTANKSATMTFNDRPVVTDGTHLRSLHEDFISIDEPTIGFLSMNWGMQSFTYSEYLSLALAKVWSRRAVLPKTEELWRIYEQRIHDRGGYGRHLQFLGIERTSARIRFFVAWLNDAAGKFGGRQIDAESKDLKEISAVWFRALYGVDRYADGSSVDSESLPLDWVYGEDW
ncbi:Dimethylaniline monooxygenase [Mycena kentingensis (nom. inval.)]|nr:Dimethylaniline monooxygenase [Mycena kentingensis (nom. inval.)]